MPAGTGEQQRLDVLRVVALGGGDTGAYTPCLLKKQYGKLVKLTMTLCYYGCYDKNTLEYYVDFANRADPLDGELRIEERTAVGKSDGGPRARTLREWRLLLGKRGHVLRGPTGKEFAVSLQAFEGRDENTPIAIYVEWVDPSRAGTKDPTGRPDAR